MGKIRLKCETCKGMGNDWNQQGNGNKIVLTDCEQCGGSGYVPVELIDKRIKSKGHGRNLPDSW